MGRARRGDRHRGTGFCSQRGDPDRFWAWLQAPRKCDQHLQGLCVPVDGANTTTSTYQIKIVSVTLNGADLGASTVINMDGGCTNLGNPFTLGPNTTLNNLALLTANATNSQNGSLVVTYQVAIDGEHHGPSQTTTATASAPPIVGGSCPNTTFTAAQKLCVSSF